MILGDVLPNLNCRTLTTNLQLYEFIGNSWCVLVNESSALTPVCTTNLSQLVDKTPEFQKRNCKVLCLTTNTTEDNREWSKDVMSLTKTKTTNGDLPFPIISDHDRAISVALGTLRNRDGCQSTVTSCMILSPDKVLRTVYWLDSRVGRNYDEVLRLVDALQTCCKFDGKVGTPAGWNTGDKLVVLTKTTKEEVSKFAKGMDTVKLPSGRDYMRTCEPAQRHEPVQSHEPVQRHEPTTRHTGV